MQDRDFADLAGRVEGIGRAVLHLTTLLERAEIIEGPTVSHAWRTSLPERPGTALETARQTLIDLARELDRSRAVRMTRAQTDPTRKPCGDLLH